MFIITINSHSMSHYYSSLSPLQGAPYGSQGAPGAPFGHQPYPGHHFWKTDAKQPWSSCWVVVGCLLFLGFLFVCVKTCENCVSMVLMMLNNVKHVFFCCVFWGWFCWVLTWFILVPGGKWFVFSPFSGLIVPSIFFSILKYPLCRHVLLFLSISYTHIYTVFGFRVLWAVAMIWSCYLGPNIFFSKSCTECFGFFHNIFEFFCRDAQMHTSQWCIDSSVWKNWVCHSHHMLCFQSQRRVCFAPSVLTIGWFCFRHFHHPLDLMDFCNTTSSSSSSLCQPMPSDATTWRSFNGSQEVRERLHRPGGWTARERHQKRSEQNIQRPGGGDKCRDVSAVPDQWKIQSEDSISPGDEGIHVVFLFGTLFEVRRCLCLA